MHPCQLNVNSGVRPSSLNKTRMEARYRCNDMEAWKIGGLEACCRRGTVETGAVLLVFALSYYMRSILF